MILELIRKWFSDNSTIGELFVDGEWFCFSLEDVVRDGIKVQGETAIPTGVYSVIINYSLRFKRDMPLLLNVPDFSGIRIHAGNTDEDTEGCILVGQERGVDRIMKSKAAYNALFAKLKAAEEEITITISNYVRPI